MSSGVPDPVSWWADYGRGGWAPDAEFGAAFPWTLAGLVRSTWAVRDPVRAGVRVPSPGIVGIQTTLGWMDSLDIGEGEAAWWGFDAALVEARPKALPTTVISGGRARSGTDVVYGNGSSAYEEAGLSVRRADSLSSIGIEALSWKRGGVGALADAGRHVYHAYGTWASGPHRVSGALTGSGVAGSLHGGEGQDVRGEAGEARYEYATRWVTARARVGRSCDVHESFGAFLEPSRRDAQQNDAELELTASGPRAGWGARLEWNRARVVRSTFGAPRREWNAANLWSVVRGERPLGEGRISGALGLGRHGGVNRVEAAPALAYVFGDGPFSGRLSFERVMSPVWSDLAGGQGGFLQSTWAARAGVDFTSPRGSRAQLSWLMGQTHDRALVSRQPLEDLWLRSGYRADSRGYDFGLLVAGAQWRLPVGAIGGEGFALARDGGTGPAVDPASGGKAFIEGSFRAFQGDLGVRLRLEAGVVGPRESEAAVPSQLAGYATYGASVILTIADLVLSIRATNLEDRRRPETWMDSATGSEALGPGRESRLLLTWRLFN